MKISKKSWHYRMARWVTPDDELASGELPSMSLCAYCERVFRCVPAAVLFCLLLPVFIPLIVCEVWPKTWRPKNKISSGPRTLFGKWLKAKKEKVCPMLEWTEE